MHSREKDTDSYDAGLSPLSMIQHKAVVISHKRSGSPRQSAHASSCCLSPKSAEVAKAPLAYIKHEMICRPLMRNADLAAIICRPSFLLSKYVRSGTPALASR